MNANTIINENMTLEQKLSAIDAAMKLAQAEHKARTGTDAPIDPADLLACESCQ